jgi:uncharacterized glyoxalase superfamily protein PhnB
MAHRDLPATAQADGGMKAALALLLAIAPALAGHASAGAAPSGHVTQDVPTMKLQSSYPVIVTDRMANCRDFYVRYLGFEAVFESTWFVYLESGGEHPVAIAFMTPEHPSSPPGPERFNGEGMFLTLQVADAAAEFERLQRTGVAIAYPLAEEPWGQRRFGLHDPSGMWLDVVEQTEPAPGFWDAYMPAPES